MTNSPNKILSVLMWIALLMVSLMFLFAGFTKISTPIPELSEMMPWAGEYPEAFVRSIGVIDLIGGLALLLPPILKITPKPAMLAIYASIALQVCAAIFHLSRGEAAVVPLNVILLVCLFFVLWMRKTKAPFQTR